MKPGAKEGRRRAWRYTAYEGEVKKAQRKRGPSLICLRCGVKGKNGRLRVSSRPKETANKFGVCDTPNCYVHTFYLDGGTRTEKPLHEWTKDAAASPLPPRIGKGWRNQPGNAAADLNDPRMEFGEWIQIPTHTSDLFGPNTPRPWLDIEVDGHGDALIEFRDRQGEQRRVDTSLVKGDGTKRRMKIETRHNTYYRICGIGVRYDEKAGVVRWLLE